MRLKNRVVIDVLSIKGGVLVGARFVSRFRNDIDRCMGAKGDRVKAQSSRLMSRSELNFVSAGDRVWLFRNFELKDFLPFEEECAFAFVRCGGVSFGAQLVVEVLKDFAGENLDDRVLAEACIGQVQFGAVEVEALGVAVGLPEVGGIRMCGEDNLNLIVFNVAETQDHLFGRVWVYVVTWAEAFVEEVDALLNRETGRECRDTQRSRSVGALVGRGRAQRYR